MDFDWTEDDVKYREDIRTFLREALPPNWAGWHRASVEEYRRESKRFCAAMAKAGFFTQNWPVEYGGQGASAWKACVLSEVFATRGDPRGPQYMNVTWIGPAIMQYGTPEQMEYHLKRISAGDVCWCQGFSEPDAGSDLASLRTRAVREGDEYVINGTKIWTSHVPLAEFCFLLVRTHPTEKRSGGISCLLVPMDTPGLEVRAIPGLLGEGAFAQLIFTDARVPVSCRLGSENRGWEVVRWALAFERVGVAHYCAAGLRLDRIAKRADDAGLMDDAELRSKLGHARAMIEAARVLFYRIVDLREHDSPPTADANVSRIAGTAAYQAVAEVAQLVADLGTDTGAGGLNANSVAAGTTEVQLDQVATRYLGLPRPPVRTA